MKWQLGEVDVVAGQHDLAARRFVIGDFDHRLRIGEPALVFGQRLFFRNPQGGGNPFTAAVHIGD